MPPAEQLASWFQVCTWLGGFIATIVAIAVGIKKLREPKPTGIPHPLTVTQHVSYTPQQLHDELEKDFRAFTERTDLRFAAMSKASSESRDKIYQLIRDEMGAMNTRFTDLLGALRELKGEIKHLSK